MGRTYDPRMSIIDDTAAADTTTIDLTARGSAEDVPAADPGQSQEQVGVRPQFSITDAAVACAVSRKTITRKLADLAEHGAAKDDDGVWRIPVEALLAVGLHPGRSVPERPMPDRPAPTTSQGAAPSGPPSAPTRGLDMISVPRDRWDDLRIRLARAEAQAAERELALADARLALRALTAGPASSGPTNASPVPVASSPTPAHEAAITVGAAPMAGAGADPAQPAIPGAAQGPSHAPVIAPSPSHVPPSAAAAAPAVESAPDPTAQVALARNEAARTGGYVPAGGPTAKRRRWWQSKGA